VRVIGVIRILEAMALPLLMDRPALREAEVAALLNEEPEVVIKRKWN
jgi:hypothetical protein